MYPVQVAAVKRISEKVEQSTGFVVACDMEANEANDFNQSPF